VQRKWLQFEILLLKLFCDLFSFHQRIEPSGLCLTTIVIVLLLCRVSELAHLTLNVQEIA